MDDAQNRNQSGCCPSLRQVPKTLMRTLRGLQEAARHEILGYAHVSQKLEKARGRASMNTGIKTVTFVFTVMSTEYVVRAAIWTSQWEEPAEQPIRPDNLDFSSSFARDDQPSGVASNASLPGARQGPIQLSVSLICMLAVIVNSAIWTRRKTFSAMWHTIHYMTASMLLIMSLPRTDLYPAMTEVKFLCTAMNLLVFQLILGHFASLTATHHLTVVVLTLLDFMWQAKYQFKVDQLGLPLSNWDCQLHTILPILLMLCLACASARARRDKDLHQVDELADVAKVLNSLSSGAALTVSFPEKIKRAARARKTRQTTDPRSQVGSAREDPDACRTEASNTPKKRQMCSKLIQYGRNSVEEEDLEQGKELPESFKTELDAQSLANERLMGFKLSPCDIHLANRNFLKILSSKENEEQQPTVQLITGQAGNRRTQDDLEVQVAKQVLLKSFTNSFLKPLDNFAPETNTDTARYSSEESECDSNLFSNGSKCDQVCLYDVMRRNHRVTKYFKVLSSSACTESQQSESSQTLLDVVASTKILKVEVKTLRLSNKVRYQLIVVSDVSHLLRYERKKIKSNFQHQLTASLAHEQLTPLNSIVNVAQILNCKLQADIQSQKYGDPTNGASPCKNSKQLGLVRQIVDDQKHFYEHSLAIWGSAQIMHIMIQSQMSLTKLNTRMLRIKFEKISQPLPSMVLDFFKPFYHLLQAKQLKGEVAVVANKSIPPGVCADWNIYQNILFQLVQNAIKFNNSAGSIRIILSFHTFEEEFAQDAKTSQRSHRSPNQNDGSEKETNLANRDKSLNGDMSHDDSSRRWSYYNRPQDQSNQLLIDTCNQPNLGLLSHRSAEEEQQIPDENAQTPSWGYILTQVIDSGDGIKRKTLKKLFSTFNQPNISQFKTQGIGIGLSTVKQLSKSVCGGVTLQSIPSVGTNVCFSIQVRNSEQNLDLQQMRNTTAALKRALPSSCDIFDPRERLRNNSKQLIESNGGRVSNNFKDNSSRKLLGETQRNLDLRGSQQSLNDGSNSQMSNSSRQQQDKDGRIFHGSQCLQSEVEALHNAVLSRKYSPEDLEVTAFDDQAIKKLLDRVVQRPPNVVKRRRKVGAKEPKNSQINRCEQPNQRSSQAHNSQQSRQLSSQISFVQERRNQSNGNRQIFSDNEQNQPMQLMKQKSKVLIGRKLWVQKSNSRQRPSASAESLQPRGNRRRPDSNIKNNNIAQSSVSSYQSKNSGNACNIQQQERDEREGTLTRKIRQLKNERFTLRPISAHQSQLVPYNNPVFVQPGQAQRNASNRLYSPVFIEEERKDYPARRVGLQSGNLQKRAGYKTIQNKLLNSELCSPPRPHRVKNHKNSSNQNSQSKLISESQLQSQSVSHQSGHSGVYEQVQKLQKSCQRDDRKQHSAPLILFHQSSRFEQLQGRGQQQRPLQIEEEKQNMVRLLASPQLRSEQERRLKFQHEEEQNRQDMLQILCKQEELIQLNKMQAKQRDYLKAQQNDNQQEEMSEGQQQEDDHHSSTEAVPDESIFAINDIKSIKPLAAAVDDYQQQRVENKPCCDKATVLLTSSQFQLAGKRGVELDNLPLKEILLSAFGIKSLQISSSAVKAERVIRELQASMRKQCCSQRFKVVVIDLSDSKTIDIYARILQEQVAFRVPHRGNEDPWLGNLTVIASDGKTITEEQLEQIVKIHSIEQVLAQ